MLDYLSHCKKHNDGEDIGTDGVCHGPSWLEVDDDGGEEDGDGHQHVSEDVEIGSVDVQVLSGLLLLLVLMLLVAVIVIA